jgi:hypothetical protein
MTLKPLHFKGMSDILCKVEYGITVESGLVPTLLYNNYDAFKG